MIRNKSLICKLESVSGWSVNEVVSWIKKVKLSQDYSPLIIQNDINGLALVSMKQKEDWEELGITVVGHQRALSIKKVFRVVKELSNFQKNGT